MKDRMENIEESEKRRDFSNIKIAFFDIDGTLRDFEKRDISPKTLETLQRLKENGIRLVLATGRAPLLLPKFEGVEFDAYLTFNGSYCYTNEKTILSRSIPKEDVHMLMENAARLKRPVAIATKDTMAANGTDTDLEEYYALAKERLEVAPNFEEVIQEEIYQIMMGLEAKDYEAMLQNVKNARITAWWDRAVDIIPAGGGKGTGVEKILEHFGLDKSESIAFGDGCNDIEMLRTAGIGVAMGNASDIVKKEADLVCGTVKEEGIYTFCLGNGLI